MIYVGVPFKYDGILLTGALLSTIVAGRRFCLSVPPSLLNIYY